MAIRSNRWAQAGEPRLALEEGGGGAGDPLLLVPAAPPPSAVGGAGAALDLDEHQQVAAAGHQVDLAHRRGVAPGQDAEAARRSSQAATVSREPAGPLALLPAHSAPGRRARARR